MPEQVQHDCGVVIGRDYPAPIVDHDEARRATLERFSVLRRGGPAAARA